MFRGHDPLGALEATTIPDSDGRIEVIVAGERKPWRILPEGTRIRHRVHPELTGYIKHWEFNKPGVVSPVPYCIGWDDSARACDVLGWFFVYASDASVEAVA